MMLAEPATRRIRRRFARQLDASSRHDTRDRLASLSMPVHVIGGEHDILVPIWKSEEIAELIPGRQAHRARARAARRCTPSAREEFNQLVLDFIAEHEPAAV